MSKIASRFNLSELVKGLTRDEDGFIGHGANSSYLAATICSTRKFIIIIIIIVVIGIGGGGNKNGMHL